MSDFFAVQIPQNLEELSKVELIALIRQLVVERTLPVPPQKKRKAVDTSVGASHAVAIVAAPAVITPTQIDAVKKRMGKAVFKAVKKATHGGSKKPKVEVFEGNMSPAMIHAIMKVEGESLTPTSDTKLMTKWVLHNDLAITDIIKSDRLVHPVRHDGKGFIPPGANVYAWAGFDMMEVKYTKKDQSLALKVKSFVAATGPPDLHANALEYSKRECTELNNHGWH